MLGVVNKAVEQLAGDADGKRKTFTDASMKKWDDFLNVFDKRNMTKSVKLAEVVAKARKVTKGLDATAIRNETHIQKEVKEGFDKIQKELSNMLVEKPSRKIRLV